MKTRILAVFLLSLAFPIGSTFAEISFPSPMGVVNDFAEILSDETEQQLTAIIEEIEAKTSAEVAVVTVKSLDGNDPNYYSVELGRTWGVGNKERDDGVVFLTAVDDHETYIATGYGVEGFITDSQAFWITDNVVVPYFKVGDYDGGILAGTQEIKKALVDLEKLPEATESSSDGFETLFDLVFWFILFMGFVLPWLTAVFARSKRWWPGGIVGAVMAIILIVFFSVTIFIILPLTIFGFLFDYLASKNYKKGKSSFWTGGGRSGWGGGSSFGGGGGFSGGSSGGFSGGSFGGGGGGSHW